MLPIKEVIKTVGSFCSKNSSTILSIGAGLGVALTGYLGVKAGMKMAMDITDLQFENLGEDISPKEKATVVIKDCAPTIAVGGLTIAMIASSRIIDIRKAKAMAMSYALLQESAETMRRKAVEKLGDRKVDEINGELAKENFDKYEDENGSLSPIERSQAVNTGEGNYYALEDLSKQVFLTNANTVITAKNRFDKYVLQGEEFITVNEWLGALGLRQLPEPLGDLGWPACAGIPLETPLPSCETNNGEPGYYLKYYMAPMTEEAAASYSANNYIDSWT